MYKSCFVNLSVLTAHDQICGGGGGGYSLITPVSVCATQWGHDFGTPGLKQGIHI